VAHGQLYGLSLNWDKTVLLPIRHDACLVGEGGERVKVVEQAMYLGGLLDQSGNPTTELSRRLGEAGKVFDQLARVWKHTNIKRSREIQIYRACIIPKLMYGLETLWLRKAELQRLNGFHARCLRKALGIAHPYLSHISNAEVLHRSGEMPLSNTLLQRQLFLYGKVARMPPDSLQRKAALEPNSVMPRSCEGIRRRGRPKQTWTHAVHQHAAQLAGSKAELERLLDPSTSWSAWVTKVRSYITSLQEVCA